MVGEEFDFMISCLSEIFTLKSTSSGIMWPEVLFKKIKDNKETYVFVCALNIFLKVIYIVFVQRFKFHLAN
jgi:hypothetical protein